MSIVDIWANILAGLATSAIISLLAFSIKPIRLKIKSIWHYYQIMRKMGMKLFLPDSSFSLLQIFERMIENGKFGDEILIIGRTLRWIIEKNEDNILDGIKKGLHLKLLVFNPQKANDNINELKVLQLTDANTISNDLSITIPRLRQICSKAKQQKYRGAIDVRVCNFLIINSLTALNTEKSLQAILDFSFRESQDNKYQQYFECATNDETQFAYKLYNFYQGIYEQSESYIKYCQGSIIRGQPLTKKIIKEEMIGKVLQKHSAYEDIRKNQPVFLLPKAIKIFDTVLNKTPPSFPVSVQIELTNECNTKCKHCLRHTWQKNKEEMSTNTIKNILSELADYRVQSVTFSGGEPTKRYDFLEILEHASTKGLKIGILTNGLEINQDMADAITRYSSWVRISLDASTPSMYSQVRGVKTGFQQVINSLDNLLSEAKRNGHSCRIGVCYSIQKMNIDKAMNLIEYLKKEFPNIEDKFLIFKFVHGSNGFLCDKEQIEKFYQENLYRISSTWGKMTNLPYLKEFIDTYSNLNDITDGVPMKSFYKNNRIRCFTPYLFSLIDAFGDVYPCCFLYHDNEANKELNKLRRRYRMGRLKNESFKDIWCSDKYQQFREDLETIDINRMPECQECTRHYLHNTFLSELFNEYQDFLIDSYENELEILRNEFSQYSSQVIWL